MGYDISASNMTNFLMEQLETCLIYARKAHHSIGRRVTITNHLSCGLWYMLQLYPEEKEDLIFFDNLVRDFV